MKVSRSFALELEDMKVIEEVARSEKVSENEALGLLVRHGAIRIKQMEKQYATLAPDVSDMR